MFPGFEQAAGIVDVTFDLYSCVFLLTLVLFHFLSDPLSVCVCVRVSSSWSRHTSSWTSTYRAADINNYSLRNSRARESSSSSLSSFSSQFACLRSIRSIGSIVHEEPLLRRGEREREREATKRRAPGQHAVVPHALAFLLCRRRRVVAAYSLNQRERKRLVVFTLGPTNLAVLPLRIHGERVFRRRSVVFTLTANYLPPRA